MALNTPKCNHMTPLPVKGLSDSLSDVQVAVDSAARAWLIVHSRQFHYTVYYRPVAPQIITVLSNVQRLNNDDTIAIIVMTLAVSSTAMSLTVWYLYTSCCSSRHCQ